MFHAHLDHGRSIESWPEALEAACRSSRHFRVVHVLRETASTQDAALRLGPGAVVTAGRQVAGRGRLGAAWADTQDQGVAVTFTLGPLPAERLGMAAAVASAEALVSLLPPAAAMHAGIKWPNDIVSVRPCGSLRKLCGVLVERTDQLSLVGMGVNVRQSSFPGDLAARATSLAMLGGRADRLEVLLGLLHRLDHWLEASDADLAAGYRRLDRTAGLRLRFLTPSGAVEGLVLDCDPMRGLRIRTRSGEVHLAAATTRVDPEPSGGRTTMPPP